MTIHESSFLKSGSGYGPFAGAISPSARPDDALSMPASVKAAALRLTTNNPEPLRKFLRDVVPFDFSRTSLICFGMFVKVVMRPPHCSKLLARPRQAWRHA